MKPFQRQLHKHNPILIMNKPNHEDQQDYEETLAQIAHQLQQHPLSSLEDVIHDQSSISAFFKAKNVWMTHYLLYQNLYILHRVSNGGNLPEKLLDGLLYSKTLVSKMAMVQKKLQYQVEKIMQASATAQPVPEKDEEIDVLALKPRPHMLTSQYEENGKKYVPPRLSAVLSTQDQLQEKIQKQEERRKTYLKRRLKETLLEEDQEAPEVLQVQDYQKRYLGQEQDPAEIRKQQYEEEYFVRLPTTKADRIREKRREKQMRQEERLDNLGELNDISRLLHMEGMGEDENVHRTDRNIMKLKEKRQTLMKSGKRKFKTLTKKK